MSVVYSLYDALVSIKVPDEKAKAVIDAMEREMMDKLATKSDVENLRVATKSDMENLRIATKSDIENLRVATKADLFHVREVLSMDIKSMELKVDVKLADFGRKLTTQMYLAISGSAALTCSILGTLIVLSR